MIYVHAVLTFALLSSFFPELNTNLGHKQIFEWSLKYGPVVSVYLGKSISICGLLKRLRRRAINIASLKKAAMHIF